MKTFKRVILCVLLVGLLVLGLTSCISGDIAQGTIESFVEAVESGDYDTAKTYLHPDRPVDLATYFERIESEKNVDFSSGFEIVKYTGVKSSYHDSSVDGSTYETTARVKIGDTEAELTVEIVENGSGYGIYNFELNF